MRVMWLCVGVVMKTKEDKIKELIQKYVSYEHSFTKEPAAFMSAYRDMNGKKMTFNEMWGKKQRRLDGIIKKIVEVANAQST